MILSIGTTHPWNIAGVGLDLRVGAEHDVHVCTVVTAVSAQDDAGLTWLETIPSNAVRAQLRAIPKDAITAIRVGALTSLENVGTVAEFLRTMKRVPAVVDPVIKPTLAGTFASESTVQAIRERVASLPNVILTPNIEEAQALLGGGAIDRDMVGTAATSLQRLGARAVLVKGGHLQGNPVDALATAEHVELFSHDRLPSEMRGTGCVLAMALACKLGRGEGLRDAVMHARTFVRRKIAQAKEFGEQRVAY